MEFIVTAKKRESHNVLFFVFIIKKPVKVNLNDLEYGVEEEI